MEPAAYYELFWWPGVQITSSFLYIITKLNSVIKNIFRIEMVCLVCWLYESHHNQCWFFCLMILSLSSSIKNKVIIPKIFNNIVSNVFIPVNSRIIYNFPSPTLWINEVSYQSFGKCKILIVDLCLC
jgi:hypothetical protein